MPRTDRYCHRDVVLCVDKLKGQVKLALANFGESRARVAMTTLRDARGIIEDKNSLCINLTIGAVALLGAL